MNNDELKILKIDFEHWKQQRPYKNSKIPKKFWDRACEVSLQYGTKKVAQSLKITTAQIDRRLAKSSKSANRKVKKKTKNLEVVEFAPIKLSPTQPKQKEKTRPSLIAELVSPSGISVRFFSGIDMEILKTFTTLIQEA